MKKIILVLAACLSLSVFALEEIKTKTEDLAPKGYSWCEAPHVGVSILKPDAWYVHEPIMDKGTYVFRLSREAPGKGFHTGLTLNIITKIKEKSNAGPTRYAAHFILQKNETAKQIELFDFVELAEEIKRCGITVEQEMEIGGITQKYTVHYTLFANEKTGTLYIFTFGTPSDKWGKDKDIWSTMNEFKINSDL